MPSRTSFIGYRSRIAAALLSLAGAGAAVVLPASSAHAAQCWGNVS